VNGPTPLTVTRSICPLCQKEMLTNWCPDNIHFLRGDEHHFDLRLRISIFDTLILAQRSPVHYEMKVKSVEDLDARVVRSTSGTIRIPELGIDIEPGAASESFVSNIEGVIERVEEDIA